MEKRSGVGRPRICVCVPSGVTEVQRRAVEEAVYKTGAKTVYVMEEPLAAAVGANVDIYEAKGNIGGRHRRWNHGYCGRIPWWCSGRAAP